MRFCAACFVYVSRIAARRWLGELTLGPLYPMVAHQFVAGGHDGAVGCGCCSIVGGTSPLASQLADAPSHGRGELGLCSAGCGDCGGLALARRMGTRHLATDGCGLLANSHSAGIVVGLLSALCGRGFSIGAKWLCACAGLARRQRANARNLWFFADISRALAFAQKTIGCGHTAGADRCHERVARNLSITPLQHRHLGRDGLPISAR